MGKIIIENICMVMGVVHKFPYQIVGWGLMIVISCFYADVFLWFLENFCTKKNWSCMKMIWCGKKDMLILKCIPLIVLNKIVLV